jgi:hypothetical protein
MDTKENITLEECTEMNHENSHAFCDCDCRHLLRMYLRAIEYNESMGEESPDNLTQTARSLKTCGCCIRHSTKHYT